MHLFHVLFDLNCVDSLSLVLSISRKKIVCERRIRTVLEPHATIYSKVPFDSLRFKSLGHQGDRVGYAEIVDKLLAHN